LSVFDDGVAHLRAADRVLAGLLHEYGPPARQRDPGASCAARGPRPCARWSGCRAETTYLRSPAEHAVSGKLGLDRLRELDDETIVAELVAVKGVGTWTAHTFLMFQLERPDVLPVGDLGIRRAVQRAYGLPTDRRPTSSPAWRIRGGPTGRCPAGCCGARWATRRVSRGGP